MFNATRKFQGNFCVASNKGMSDQHNAIRLPLESVLFDLKIFVFKSRKLKMRFFQKFIKNSSQNKRFNL